jgi:hypothetical protein
MKKIIIIAFAILTTGLVSSCTKDNVKPKTSIVSDKSDMGSGDLAGGDTTGGN